MYVMYVRLTHIMKITYLLTYLLTYLKQKAVEWDVEVGSSAERSR